MARKTTKVTRKSPTRRVRKVQPRITRAKPKPPTRRRR